MVSYLRPYYNPLKYACVRKDKTKKSKDNKNS